ncbi:hypothetical protein C8J57DRAFT_1499270 [Mycena rebaudengoi]|nr:hypothetical protein C8J57DRAFT_1499270 [Mycena rebaudengoi]
MYRPGCGYGTLASIRHRMVLQVLAAASMPSMNAGCHALSHSSSPRAPKAQEDVNPRQWPSRMLHTVGTYAHAARPSCPRLRPSCARLPPRHFLLHRRRYSRLSQIHSTRPQSESRQMSRPGSASTPPYSSSSTIPRGWTGDKLVPCARAAWSAPPIGLHLPTSALLGVRWIRQRIAPGREGSAVNVDEGKRVIRRGSAQPVLFSCRCVPAARLGLDWGRWGAHAGTRSQSCDGAQYVRTTTHVPAPWCCQKRDAVASVLALLLEAVASLFATARGPEALALRVYLLRIRRCILHIHPLRIWGGGGRRWQALPPPRVYLPQGAALYPRPSARAYRCPHTTRMHPLCMPAGAAYVPAAFLRREREARALWAAMPVLGWQYTANVSGDGQTADASLRDGRPVV